MTPEILYPTHRLKIPSTCNSKAYLNKFSVSPEIFTKSIISFDNHSKKVIFSSLKKVDKY